MEEILKYISETENINVTKIAKFCIKKKLWKELEKNQEIIIRIIDEKKQKF